MTTTQEQGQRIVHLIRHGEKNPSTAAVDPNQLTEKGRRDALAYGAGLRSTPTLEVYCSTDAEGKPVDRSHDTGWYIHAGYAGLGYDDANALFRSDSSERAQFVPGLDQRLQQRVPQRILNEYKANKITRAEAMEQCYQMILGEAGTLEEQKEIAQAVLLHLNTSISYARLGDPSSGIVLVGHDPVLGALRQLFHKDLHLKELQPLDGLRIYEDRGLNTVFYVVGEHKGTLISTAFPVGI
jgi:phosphohistidine phosphatase SixA